MALSAASSQTVTVNYAVTGGTATGGGVDYTLLGTGTLTFTPGDTSENVSLTIINDTLDEDDETVIVTLSSPVNATLGANTTHTRTITDNDNPPTVAFNATSSSGSEATSPAIWQFRCQRPPVGLSLSTTPLPVGPPPAVGSTTPWPPEH